VSLRSVPLEDILVDLQPGFASGANLDDGTLQVRMNNVKPDGSWDWSKKRRVPATPNQLSRYSLQKNDILFNATNSPEQVGKSAIYKGLSEVVTFSNHFLRLRVNSKLASADYLTRYFAYLWQVGVFKNLIDAWVNQATVKREAFIALKIPLPSLEEQKRIAVILDKADAIRRKRQQAIELADQFLRSVFLDMFGDPLTNPKGWPKRPISKFGDVITGNTPSRKVPEYYGDHIEWIKSDNINTPKHFLTCANEYLSAEGLTKARSAPAGSLLVTCIAGSKDCIGNIAIADRAVSFNQQINAIVPYEGETLNFLYAQLLYNKNLVRAASTKSMKGMVSKSKFLSIELIYPDEALQQTYSEIFSKSLEWAKKQEDGLAFSNNIFNALSQRAFNGDLMTVKAA